MSTKKCSIPHQMLENFLEKTANEVGRASGFVKRASKLTAAGFAKVVVLGLGVQPAASLAELADYSESWLGVRVSPQGLDERLHERTVVFLQSLLARALMAFQPKVALASEVLQQFSRIQLLDSSIITLPKALAGLYRGCGTDGGEAALKVQLSYDYLHGQIQALQVVAGRSPDQKCPLVIEQATANSLHLFDLGYFTQERFAALAAACALFISRLQPQTALYRPDGDQPKLDLAATLSGVVEDLYEASYLLGTTARLPIRLIAQRLPAAIVQERRRKARAKFRKKGQLPSQAYLTLLAWNVFITNVPAQRLSAQQVIALYRLRWQIELLFKLYKSQAGLDLVGNCRPERVLCFFYARLIALVIFHWLSAPLRLLDQRELSLPKAFRLWQAALPDLARLAATSHRLARRLAVLLDDFSHKALKSKRKKAPSSLARFLALQPVACS